MEGDKLGTLGISLQVNQCLSRAFDHDFEKGILKSIFQEMIEQVSMKVQ